MSIWVWNHLPASVDTWRLVRAYGAHLHSLIQLQTTRMQSVGTFFFRNRPELQLLTRLIDQKPDGSSLGVAILGCSKGAEVYSISYAVRNARPDMKVGIHALDISKDVLEFAKAGFYSLRSESELGTSENVVANTSRDQLSSIFERMSSAEMVSMFDQEGDLVRVKPRYREGIDWRVGDAGDTDLVGAMGLQDIVVANRFLCHMHPEAAERCLSRLARLVKPGGYLFISGVDLSVRSKVAQRLGLRPVTELIREIHDGDPSIRNDWPLNYWGLEPFDSSRADWRMWYASVFQRAEHSGAM